MKDQHPGLRERPPLSAVAQVHCQHRVLLIINITVITVLITVYITPSSVLIIRHTWETDLGWGDEESRVDRQFGPSSETS